MDTARIRIPERQFAGFQESLQDHHPVQHIDRGTSGHFLEKQILAITRRRKCHASIVEKNHGIWICSEFSRRTVADQLCFRCLAQGHQGKDCPRRRQCGQDGWYGFSSQAAA